jgi:hypothetical protein
MEVEMIAGGRITDEVDHYRLRGEYGNTVRIVRQRPPERLRWRTATSLVTSIAGKTQGLERMRIEEPIRELVLDLDDRILRREVTLDARRNGVDLDRGEILAPHTMWDLKRTAYLAGVDLEILGRYVSLPGDYSKSIDTAAVALVGRTLAGLHRKRAQKLIMRVSGTDGSQPMKRYQQFMLERAGQDNELARRWTALAKTMVKGSR